MFITLSPKEGESGIVKEFKLPLMNLEVDLLEIPDTEYTADIHMVSNQFTELVNQLSIFGNEINLGLFNLRSTVTTQGNVVFSSSTPESISLFKKTSFSCKSISEINVA